MEGWDRYLGLRSLVGAPATVWIDPFPIPRVAVEGKVQTVANGKSASLKANRLSSGETDIWQISGTIPVDSAPVLNPEFPGSNAVLE